MCNRRLVQSAANRSDSRWEIEALRAIQHGFDRERHTQE